MKKILFALFAICILNVAKAQEFIDFGEEYGMWKGDFAVGDIDNDGDLDIIFSGEENGNEKGGVFLNDGNGNFTAQEGERIVKLGLAGNIQFGDIDGDGDLDIIYAGWGSGSTSASRGIALNNGNGIYTVADAAKYPILGSSKVTSCGFADFNLDGLLDYYFFGNFSTVDEVVVGNCVIYFQNPNGSFTANTNAFPTHRFNEPEVTLVDFNRDGAIDIWVNAANEDCECDNGNQTGESMRFSALFKNDGMGNFTEYSFGANGLTFNKSNGTSSWADVDGDGYMDLLHNGDGFLCSGETNDRVNRVYKNLGGTGLEEKFAVEVARVGHFGNGTAWLDWNGDGKLDFISGGWDNDINAQATYLYLGDNSGNFTFTKGNFGSSIPGVSEQGYRIADLNNDGRPDFLECGFGSIGRRVTGWAKNTTSPAVAAIDAPANLVMTADPGDPTCTILSWEVPASLQGKPGITWNISLRNTTTGKWFYNPMAVVGSDKNGWRKVGGRPGNVFTNTEYYLYELPNGQYEWTVQAIDGSYFGGAFAATKTFSITNSSIRSVKGYNPEVFTTNKLLQVLGTQGAMQTLKVYNLSGILINTASFTGETTLEISQVGIYIVELLNENGGSYKTKVVIK